MTSGPRVMARPRPTSPALFACLTALVLAAPHARAATVTNLRATFHDGQTFLTWDNLPGSGWTYRVLSSASPFVTAGDADYAITVGQVGDASAIDKRISSILGVQSTYRIAADQSPLAPTQGLFVRTARVGALNHYAVLAQATGGVEDRTFARGKNATRDPVFERVEYPQPVWQRTLTSPIGEDYVLWTSHESTPVFPVMCNRPGWAYHVGVIPGVPGGALVLGGHGRGGNFLNSLHGTGAGGEWVLSFDDYLPNADFASFYFGYEQGYDITQPYNLPRATGGVVADYTERRVMYLLDWAKREMPHDPMRVYASGGSMGGSFAFFMAWHHPDRVAGSLLLIPKLCLGYRPDSYVELRQALDRQWGSPDLNLPTTTGLRVFQWMDGREQARIHRNRGSAPIVGFCGRYDTSVGWGEKVAYFDAMRTAKAGGMWFWDASTHYTPVSTMSWFPMMDERQLYKYRLDTSYPAFSNASTDNRYGNGDPTTADSLGQINGVLDWDERAIVDVPLQWEIVLRTRAVTSRVGTVPAPSVVTVDVTPRRLQKLIVAQRVMYRFEVRRVSDGVVIQSGTVTPDEDAVLTVRRVNVLQGGSRLRVYPVSTTGVEPGLAARHQPQLELSRNPVLGSASLTVEWPGQGDAMVELFDMQGRRLRAEFQGATDGHTERTFRTDGLAAGVYVLCARQGTASTTHRVIVLQ